MDVRASMSRRAAAPNPPRFPPLRLVRRLPTEAKRRNHPSTAGVRQPLTFPEVHGHCDAGRLRPHHLCHYGYLCDTSHDRDIIDRATSMKLTSDDEEVRPW